VSDEQRGRQHSQLSAGQYRQCAPCTVERLIEAAVFIRTLPDEVK